MKLHKYNIFKFLAYFVVIFFAFNLSITAQVSINDSLDYYSLGLEAHESENYNEALKFYNKQLEVFPNDVRSYNNRGNILMEMDNEVGALEDYLMALFINPSVHLVRYNIGVLKFNQGLFGESVKFYKQELEVNPFYCGAYNNLGYAYYMLEEFDLAIESYNKAMLLDSNCTYVQENLKDAIYQKNVNEKWKEKMAKYKMIIYDSTLNQLKELGFPSAYNKKFVFSPHYIYENWNTYSGVILKFNQFSNILLVIRSLKDGLEDGYGVHFNNYRDLNNLSYISQTNKYKINISYGLKYNYKERKFDTGLVPKSARITQKFDNKYFYIDVTYKNRKLKIRESQGLKKVSLFDKRLKDSSEFLEFLKSKENISNELIEQFVTMGGTSRVGKSKEEIITDAGFKSLIIKLEQNLWFYFGASFF